MRTNRSFFVYVIVHCSNRRHLILCCHLQDAEARSGDGAERQPSPQLVLYVSSAAPPHTTEGSSAVIRHTQCNLLFAPRSCGFASLGNSGVVFPDVCMMELAMHLKKSPNVVSRDSTDDAQQIKTKSCNVKVKYCNPFVLQECTTTFLGTYTAS